MISRKHFIVALLAGSALAALALAQAPAAAGRGGRGGRAGAAGASGAPAGRGGRAGGFTQFTRPLASQDVIARGKTLFEANCASCHASDFRGTAKGVNIVRSGIALRDQHGELIGDELGKHNPPITLVPADTVATAEYVHAVLATAGRQGRPPGADPSGLELNVLVGDMNAGKTYFGAHCASCHSITGDLKGIGAKYADDPRGQQGAWDAGTGGGGGGRGGRGGRGGEDGGSDWCVLDDAPVDLAIVAIGVAGGRIGKFRQTIGDHHGFEDCEMFQNFGDRPPGRPGFEPVLFRRKSGCAGDEFIARFRQVVVTEFALGCGGIEGDGVLHVGNYSGTVLGDDTCRTC